MTVAYGGEKVALYMNVDKTKWLAVGIGANNEHGIGQVGRHQLMVNRWKQQKNSATQAAS